MSLSMLNPPLAQPERSVVTSQQCIITFNVRAQLEAKVALE
jgi:hypothetical protein